ncbi:MAG: peroxide stress protein YaaA [Bacteroidota bacterium]
MLLILSPSKTLDYASPLKTEAHSQPVLLEESKILAQQLAGYSEEEIGKLMKLSPKLATLNFDRYQQFSTPFSLNNARQALLAFKGDVYTGFDLDAYKADDFEFAQQHLAILSGLYGLLKPLDLMQPYRLEMGTRMSNERGKDLYKFWGERIAHQLKSMLDGHEVPVLINLASNEYFKAVKKEALGHPIITPVFKEQKGDSLKIIALFAKQARGMMSNFAILNRITQPEDLKHFREANYSFREDLSTETEWVFVR